MHGSVFERQKQGIQQRYTAKAFCTEETQPLSLQALTPNNHKQVLNREFLTSSSTAID